MKHPLLTLLVSAAIAAAGDLPTPELLVRPGPVTAGTLALARPAGSTGEVAGGVTAESDGLVFSGDGGTVTIPFDARRTFSEPFTVAVRIEPQGIRGYGNIVNASQPEGFCLLIHGHGYYSVSGGGPAQWNKVTAPKGSVKIGSTQHVAVTWDGTAVILYVDGEEAGRGEFAGTPAAGESLVLGSAGRATEDGTVTDVPEYRLAEVAVYGNALSPAQVRTLAETGE
jgi:hypothetical protein